MHAASASEFRLNFQHAMANHLLFKSRLRSLLYDGKSEPETEILYHYDCPVGKWIYGYGLKTFPHIPEMHELESVHRDIHTIARELVHLYKEGKILEARQGLSRMETISDRLVSLLVIIENKLIVAQGDSAPAQTDEKEFSILRELLQKNEILDQRIKTDSGNLLHEQQALSNYLIQSPGILCMLRGPKHIYELVNPGYLQLIGNRLLIGLPIREALPELEGQGFFEQLDDVYKTQRPFLGKEVQVLLNTGRGKPEEAYINFVYQPILDAKKESIGILVSGYEVTEQIAARKKIEESERKFKDLVMQSPVAMGIFRGADMVIELANETLLKNIWRRDFKEVAGRRLLDVFPELQNQAFPILVAKVYQNGIPISEKESLAYINVEGTIQKFFLDFDYAPLFEPDGKTVSGIVVTVIDTTEKVESRNMINRTEISLRLAIEAANLGTFDWNLEATDFFSSPRLKEIFGFPGPADVSHQQLIDRFYPEDRPIREQAVKDSLKKGRLDYQLRIVWPDKSIHWINVYGKVLHDEQQKPLRMYGTVMDITAQKNVLESLKESETLFRLLADSMPQHIWTGDAEGNLNYFNQSVFDYSGLTLEQINNEGWLQIVHPDERAANIEAWLASVRTGNPFLFEHRFRRYDGEYRWQLSRAVPQKDEQGKIKMWVGTSTDIHDRKLFTDELEHQVQQRVQQLKQLNDELVKSNRELEQFIYVASHDLQEPLRKIQTFASGLLEYEHQNLSEKAKDYFSRMQAASVRMQQLILDLLAFSRTNTAEKHFEYTNLNVILGTVLEQLKENILQKEAEVQSNPLPSLTIIPYQFEQLFTNLISNSLKFSKPGIPPNISISSRLVSGEEIGQQTANSNMQYHQISIVDNGIGFDPEYKERIFQVFQRLHGRQEYKGTGIGLAIVKKIVENHQGLIFGNSIPGQGATFDIYIPAGDKDI